MFDISFDEVKKETSSRNQFTTHSPWKFHVSELPSFRDARYGSMNRSFTCSYESCWRSWGERDPILLLTGYQVVKSVDLVCGNYLRPANSETAKILSEDKYKSFMCSILASLIKGEAFIWNLFALVN